MSLGTHSQNGLGRQILLLAENYPPSKVGPASKVTMVEVRHDADTAFFVFGIGGREILRTPYCFNDSRQSSFAYWLVGHLNAAIAEEYEE